MTAADWRRVRELFDSAVELEPEACSRLLAQLSATEPAIGVEVARLLEAHRAAEDAAFIERPAEAAPAAAAKDLAGLLVGSRYRLEAPLGEGGFGDVYSARDEHLEGKPVVVKIARAAPERSEWLEKRFHEEIKALARIHHPGVVGALDAVRLPDGRACLVMQYVPGQTLRQALEKGPLPLEEAARLISDLGQALGAAHELGVCHRDLKPENIILRDAGGGRRQAVVIDFGAAAVMETGTTARSFTRPVGTLSYMAPEQLFGRGAAASDVYSLGLVVFEMLTGQKAAELDSDQEWPKAAGEELKRMRPEVPSQARALILQAVALEAPARPPDLRRFAEELAALLGRPRPARRRLWVVLAGLAAVIAPGLVWLRDRLIPVRDVELQVLVQRAGQKQFWPAKGEEVYRQGDRVRFLVDVPRSGYLTMVDESMSEGAARAAHIVLQPQIRVEAGRSVSVPAKTGDALVFDNRPGLERVWLVWSPTRLEELEPLGRFANPRDRGEVRDPAVAAALGRFLERHSKVRGDVVARPVPLPHR